MKTNTFKRFVIFWFSQSVSQLGSSMTSFALIIWSYSQSQSALSVSLMAFCSYLPYVAASIFAGTLVDRHSKKAIMLLTDLGAALCSAGIFILLNTGGLKHFYIYGVNLCIGLMNSLQSPAQSVAVGLLIPEEKRSQASGMDSFAGSLITVVSPVLGSALLAAGGLGLVLITDLLSFLFAFVVLFFFITIPETHTDNMKQTGIFKDSPQERKKSGGVFSGFKEEIVFLKEHRSIRSLILSMAAINFFSSLTYENILGPMILARSGYNSHVLAAVNAVLGIGGIVGGLIVSFWRAPKNPLRMIYFSSAISFLLGDMLMGFGQNCFLWCAAGAAASLPIPFVMAGQHMLLYKEVPVEIQGRIFAVRSALQFGTIPAAILSGGFLADYVFEPFMHSGSAPAMLLEQFVGPGPGSGMAVMFLCTGICGSAISVLACHCSCKFR
ncbi:MFS transporter [Murimonas intestini]|uniref:MFS transporter n=1 Tax=Murimonas intestini TaxID=1337051 RepID=A0AB73SZ22_9FIRM|nr:MFS transporter [Murimonas intestini]MCR1842922.1 MFS transporter [Murimonas intestini]MCR1868115.1 MFS transporter [Murimonas intestini]MCR1885393.1 MFS transporter [Murimonas intestini]